MPKLTTDELHGFLDEPGHLLRLLRADPGVCATIDESVHRRAS